MSNLVPVELITLARVTAARHSINAQLVCAVVEQESAWNPWAIRYEPGFLSKYVAPMYTAGKISATEAYSRSFSWGLMQVMGESARELGFSGSSLAQLCDPAVGLEWGCVKLVKHLARAKNEVTDALEAWNGGANLQYATQVLARLKNYAAS